MRSTSKHSATAASAAGSSLSLEAATMPVGSDSSQQLEPVIPSAKIEISPAQIEAARALLTSPKFLPPEAFEKDLALIPAMRAALAEGDYQALSHVKNQLAICSQRPAATNAFLAMIGQELSQDQLFKLYAHGRLEPLIELAIDFELNGLLHQIASSTSGSRPMINEELIKRFSEGDHRAVDLYEKFAFMGATSDPARLIKVFAHESSRNSYLKLGKLSVEDLKFLAEELKFEVLLHASQKTGIFATRGDTGSVISRFPGLPSSLQTLHNHPGDEAYIMPSGGFIAGRPYRYEDYGAGDLFSVDGDSQQYITSKFGVTTYRRAYEAIESPPIPGQITLKLENAETKIIKSDELGNYPPQELSAYTDQAFIVEDLLGPNRQRFQVEFIPWNKLDPERADQIGLSKFLDQACNEGDINFKKASLTITAAQQVETQQEIAGALQALVTSHQLLDSQVFGFLSELGYRDELAGIALAAIYAKSPQVAFSTIESALIEGTREQRYAAIEALNIVMPLLPEQHAKTVINLMLESGDSTQTKAVFKLLKLSTLNPASVDSIFDQILVSDNFEKETILIEAAKCPISISRKEQFYRTVFNDQTSLTIFQHRSLSGDMFGYSASSAVRSLYSSTLPWEIKLDISVNALSDIDPKALKGLWERVTSSPLALYADQQQREQLLEILEAKQGSSGNYQEAIKGIREVNRRLREEDPNSLAYKQKMEESLSKAIGNYSALSPESLAKTLLDTQIFGRQITDDSPITASELKKIKLEAAVEFKRTSHHLLRTVLQGEQKTEFLSSLVQRFNELHALGSSACKRTEYSDSLAELLLCYETNQTGLTQGILSLSEKRIRLFIDRSLDGSPWDTSLFEMILEHPALSPEDKFKVSLQGLSKSSGQLINGHAEDRRNSAYAFKRLAELDLPFDDKLNYLQQSSVLDPQVFYEMKSRFQQSGIAGFSEGLRMRQLLAGQDPELREALIDFVRYEVARSLRSELGL